ncbi:MAG: glycoside hydrolase family 9 protein [Opitutales bacterium]|nr:glycoside hydrolase family 9 protein [Opitutales bacterium]
MKIFKKIWKFLAAGVLALAALIAAFFYCENPRVAKARESAKNAYYTAKAAASYKLGSFHASADEPREIKGDVRVEVLDARNICLVGAYADFLRKVFAAEGGDFLKGLENPQANLKEWSKNVFYNIISAEIILKYRPKIARAYRHAENFSFSGGLKVKNSGYWISPIGQASFPSAAGFGERLTQNAEAAHYAFVEFEEPMEIGKKYTLKTPLGETAEFEYSPESAQNKIIKLNQVGYSPEASKKYAYIGAWRGTLGKLNLGYLRGETFEIARADDGSVAFSGVLKERVKDPFYKSGAAFTGEDVYEADFSKFSGRGEFFLRVKSLGRSMPFKISNDAIGEAFYVHAKGLFHKRCGIEKAPPFTNWTSGKCHVKIYESNFPPNNRHYKIKKDEKDCGFFDENGKPVEVSQFRLIAENASTAVPIDVAGGWHDAADYDRRPYHYDVVCDLLASYIYRPRNFCDGQLNIPESGNGIEDILDEALWGMGLWLRLQKPDGSVGGWIEADSHPKEYNPALDRQAYFLSAATRESAMQYSAHASMLALALKSGGHLKESEIWLESAARAFEWAQNPKNRFSARYDYPNNPGDKNSPLVKILYKEAEKIPPEFVFKAAFNLYLLKRDPKYLRVCEGLKAEMPRAFIQTSWKINPFFFCEFIKYGRDIKSLGGLYAELKKRVFMNADCRLEWLEGAYPYRIAWYPPEHAYVSHMSWGAFHPLRVAKFFVNAYEISKEKKYRDAAFLCNDFHNGANPFGQTMTSGLGKIYPVKFLDLPSYSDGISEYVQGITPYRNTFGINRSALALGYALVYPPRKDRGFAPKPQMVLPKSVVGDYENMDKLSKDVGKALPIWRRFANVEAYSVAASEYTVSETIAPAAAVCGWLLDGEWRPDSSLKNRKPAKDHRKLEGYAPLP